MKRKAVLQTILTVIFVCLIATPLVLKRISAKRSAASKAELDTKESLARHGFHLQEVSHAAGIDFVHQAPVLDQKLAHIMPEVASMGASVSVVDFDRDGWPDLYVTNSAIGSRNRLYRNLHDGMFQDVAGELGISNVNP